MDSLWTEDAALAPPAARGDAKEGASMVKEEVPLPSRKSMKRKAVDSQHEDHTMWKYFRSLVPRVFRPIVHATTSAGCLDPMWVCHDVVQDALDDEDAVAPIPRPLARIRNKPSHVRGETIQVGFGGCGGFYNYLLGVASVIQERFDLTDAVFSGASAGCFPALVLAMNKNVNDFFHGANLTLIRDADKKTFMGWRDWIPLTKQHTLAQLEPDTYLRLDKKFYCSITRVPSLENELVTSWKDNEDMVDCMLTSGHVPLYHPDYLRTFRGNKYIDGSVSNNDPMPLGTLAPAHVFHFWKWRKILPHWILVSTNANWANQQFEWGRADALAHLHEIEMILHYKDEDDDEQ